jgi:hypothetical protein
MNGRPESFAHVVSAGRGKVCYNVESHMDGGWLGSHQRVLKLDDVLQDFLPQIGAGIKGFLFWQYRSETLGWESPAWGLVRTDGSSRPATEAVRKFWATVRPHAAELRTAFPAPAEIGIWRSRKNEMFHFCMQNNVRPFAEAIDACILNLYWESLPHRLVNDEMLAAGELDGLKLLVMPNPYYVTQAEVDALDRWVRGGGVLVCEAHLAGYNGTTGRHSRVMPGGGLAESWGIRETETTAAVHLLAMETRGFSSLAARKALKEFRGSDGKFFPIRMSGAKLVWGAHRYAELGGEGIVPLGTFTGGAPCLARKSAGKGTVFYCGTNLAQAAQRDSAGLKTVLRMAAEAAGIEPVGRLCAKLVGTVHLDMLSDNGTPRFAVLVSKGDRSQTVRIHVVGTWHGLFSGCEWRLDGKKSVTVPAKFAEVFRIGGTGRRRGEKKV